MATAKPKVKRMMFGGAAKGMGSAGKPSATPPAGLNVAGIRKASAGLGDTFKPANAAAALRKLPMNPPRPGTAGPKPMQIRVPAGMRSSVADILRKAPTSNSPSELGRAMSGLGAAGATRGMMKKGGAVKKKATKK